MTLAISAAAIAAAGNMAEEISLERLFRLIRQTAQTLSGVLVAAFMGMTALGVRMGAARDGAIPGPEPFSAWACWPPWAARPFCCPRPAR